MISGGVEDPGPMRQFKLQSQGSSADSCTIIIATSHEVALDPSAIPISQQNYPHCLASEGHTSVAFYRVVLPFSSTPYSACPPPTAMARQPRQRPVSCTFCRTRKLRCNRQYPCSNCTSRGVICELGQGAAPPIAAPAEGLGGDAVLKLLSRLDKLEQTVKYQNEELTKTRNAVFGTAPGEGASPVLVSPIRSSTVMASTVSRGIAEPPVSVHIQRFTTDALWLESGCTSEPLTVCDSVVFFRVARQLALLSRGRALLLDYYLFHRSNVPI